MRPCWPGRTGHQPQPRQPTSSYRQPTAWLNPPGSLRRERYASTLPHPAAAGIDLVTQRPPLGSPSPAPASREEQQRDASSSSGRVVGVDDHTRVERLRVDRLHRVLVRRVREQTLTAAARLPGRRQVEALTAGKASDPSSDPERPSRHPYKQRGAAQAKPSRPSLCASGQPTARPTCGRRSRSRAAAGRLPRRDARPPVGRSDACLPGALAARQRRRLDLVGHSRNPRVSGEPSATSAHIRRHPRVRNGRALRGEDRLVGRFAGFAESRGATASHARGRWTSNGPDGPRPR